MNQEYVKHRQFVYTMPFSTIQENDFSIERHQCSSGVAEFTFLLTSPSHIEPFLYCLSLFTLLPISSSPSFFLSLFTFSTYLHPPLALALVKHTKALCIFFISPPLFTLLSLFLSFSISFTAVLK